MSLSALKFAARMAAKLEEQTTLVNETTTRVDENIPEVGGAVEPTPQEDEPLPSSEPQEVNEAPAVNPAEVEVPAPVEEPVVETPVEGEVPAEAPVVEEPVAEPTDEPIVVEDEDTEVVAEDEDGDGDIEAVEVELPEGVTAEDVEEAQTEIAEAVSEVEEDGVSPKEMRALHRSFNDTLKLFGLEELPAVESLKKDSINLRAAVKTVNTLNALKKRLNVFKK